MKLYQEYYQVLQKTLDKVFAQDDFFTKGAQILSRATANDGIIYVYGSGHSHMMGEEMFYRAGGLANVYPIFIPELMLHIAAANASVLERKEGYILPFLEKYNITSKDVMLVVSTSGRNATPIEAALYASSKGAKVITISSYEYCETRPPSHSSGKYLRDTGHVNLDNKVPAGDAALQCKNLPVAFAPLSTSVNTAVLNALVAQTIALLAEQGSQTIPVFLSGNLPDGDSYNAALIQKYGTRIAPLQ